MYQGLAESLSDENPGVKTLTNARVRTFLLST